MRIFKLLTSNKCHDDMVVNNGCYRIYSLLMLLIWLCLANSLLAKEPLQQGLLWQINKSGLTPSYLFGTIHSEDPRVTKLPTIVRDKFLQADSVTLEMLIDDAAIQKFSTAMLLKSQTLDSLVDKSLFDDIVIALKPYQLPAEAINLFKPWAIIEMLSMPPPKTGLYLDMILYKKAKKMNKPLYGLETVEEQLAIFDQMSLSEQITMLQETMEHLDEIPKLLAKLHQLYLSKNLSGMLAFNEQQLKNSDNPELLREFNKRLLDKRNVNMAERMQTQLQAGNAFIAIGALHLPGKQGVLKLLEKQGYRVSVLY